MMHDDEIRRVEALLRVWGQHGAMDDGRGRLPGMPAHARLLPMGATTGRSSAPDGGAVEEIRERCRRVDVALEGLASPLRRLVRLKYRVGHSDAICRQDVRFKGMSEGDFRLLKLNALELLAWKLGRG